MINEENVRRLAAHLRAQDKISMYMFTHHCGTPACVAGHATALFRPEVDLAEANASVFNEVLTAELGLTREQRDAIVYMDTSQDGGAWARVLGDDYVPTMPIASRVTPDQAADALLQICGVTP